MLIPLFSVLVLLAQAPTPAPASPPDAPLTVLLAPPDAAGVPSHLVEFSLEHVAEQLKARGLKVVRAQDALKRLPATRRRRLLKCIQTERRCLQSLAETARTEVLLVAELTQMESDYRVGTKVYTARDGALVAESLVPGVSEEGMLDALTRSLDEVVPKLRRTLRPGSEPEPEPTPPPVEQKPPEVKPVEPAPPVVVTPPATPAEPPPVARSGGLRRWAWAPAAGGAVFAGVGTYFLLDARKKHNALLGQGGETFAPEDGPRIADEGRSSQQLSRILFGVGAAGLLTGGLFLLFPGEEAPVRPTAAVGPGGGMVGVVGTLP